jgi:hypothetical protein
MEPFVSLFITSRQHVDLQAKFANVSQIDISASVSNIKAYLEYVISTNDRMSGFATKDIKLKEDIVKNVSEKATSM